MACAVAAAFPRESGRPAVLLVCGPGNNGGVACPRHLFELMEIHRSRTFLPLALELRMAWWQRDTSTTSVWGLKGVSG